MEEPCVELIWSIIKKPGPGGIIDNLPTFNLDYPGSGLFDTVTAMVLRDEEWGQRYLHVEAGNMKT